MACSMDRVILCSTFDTRTIFESPMHPVLEDFGDGIIKLYKRRKGYGEGRGCALFLSMGFRYLSCGVLNYDDIDNLPSRDKPSGR